MKSEARMVATIAVSIGVAFTSACHRDAMLVVLSTSDMVAACCEVCAASVGSEQRSAACARK